MGCSTSISSRFLVSCAADVSRSTCTSPPIMEGSGSLGTAAPLWPSSYTRGRGDSMMARKFVKPAAHLGRVEAGSTRGLRKV